jgi:hypothetical protein
LDERKRAAVRRPLYFKIRGSRKTSAYDLDPGLKITTVCKKSSKEKVMTDPRAIQVARI